MTKKDFEVLAEIVSMLTRGNIGRVSKRANWINDKLIKVNPKFDKKKFWDAVEDHTNTFYK